MTQLGQTLANLTNYQTELNQPNISRIGFTGQYSDSLNHPTNVSSFSNDANYAVRGENVSEFANNSKYTVQGSSNNQFTNDSNYAVRGENVSEFYNNAGYVTSSQVAGPITAIINGTGYNGETVSTVAQTNIGLAVMNSGLDAKGTGFNVNHLLPAAGSNQTYIGHAQAFCPASGIDVGILTTISYVNNTYFSVELQQTSNTGGSSSHTNHDITISWTMSLVNFAFSSSALNPAPTAAAAPSSPQTLNA